MPYNTLGWNRIRYSIYAPIYDAVAWVLNRGRRQCIDALNLSPGSRVLVAGCGSGLDLPCLPEDARITLLDISPAMLKRARKKRSSAPVLLGDVESLPFPDGCFDAVLLHCIVAVTPDAVACLNEARRVLAHDGRISLFDKFAPDDRPVSWLRRVINELTESGFSSITRQRAPLLQQSGLHVVYEIPEPVLREFRGAILAKD